MPDDTREQAARISAEAAQNRADQQRAWKAADLEYPGKSELYDSTRALFALGFRAGVDDERRESKQSGFAVWLDRLKAWQFATFPNETIAGVYEHLKEEIHELGDDLSDQSEIADCLMLLFCLAFHQDINPIEALKAKHAVNLARKWQGADGHYRHVPDATKGAA